MAEQNTTTERRGGGLYKNVRMSVKTVNIIILIGIAALIVVTVLLVSNGGFTVTFDTDGGSHIENQLLKYGELVKEPEPPVKEGWEFTGWYLDREGKYPWNMEVDTATDSFTLYAGWKEKA